MKKYTAYYVIGAVLLGTGIYLYASNKNDKLVNLEPPMVVTEEKDGTTTTTITETTVFTALDKLKELINAIKLKSNTQTPAP